MTTDTKRCAVCAAGVTAHRVLCPSCGSDTEQPDAPVVWPDKLPLFHTETRQIGRRWRRSRWMAAGMVLLLLIVGYVGMQLAGTAEVDTPTMPAGQRDAATETQREIREIGAIRTADTAGEASDPQLMLDDNPATAWIGDAPTLGLVGREQIVLRLDEPAWVSRIVIANGVHADLAAYDAHGRVRAVELLFDGGVSHAATLIDIGRILQQIELPEPVLTTAIRLTVMAVYPGQAHRDVAVSGLEIHGYPATAQQQRVARELANVQPAVPAVQE